MLRSHRMVVRLFYGFHRVAPGRLVPPPGPVLVITALWTGSPGCRKHGSEQTDGRLLSTGPSLERRSRVAGRVVSPGDPHVHLGLSQVPPRFLVGEVKGAVRGSRATYY